MNIGFKAVLSRNEKLGKKKGIVIGYWQTVYNIMWSIDIENIKEEEKYYIKSK